MGSQSSQAPALAILQLLLAVFFIATGLIFLTNYNSSASQVGRAVSQFFGKGQINVVQLITAILELCAGIVLVIGLFGVIPRNLMYLFTIIILVLWCVQIILMHFTNGFLKPDFLVWLQPFSQSAVVLAAIWCCATRYTE